MNTPPVERPNVRDPRERLGQTDWSPERFAPVVTTLTGLDWTDRRTAHARAEPIWHGLWSVRDGVVEDIHRRSGQLAEIAADFGSDPGALGLTDTGSHLKLPLYRRFEPRPDAPFAIWLHRYYDPESASGRATTVHSHRYSFTSLVLRGGFTNRLFRFEGRDGGDGRLDGAVGFERDQAVQAGDVYTMHPEAIHTVADLQPDTVTLILQSEPQFHWSTAFDLETGEVRHIPDLVAAAERFRASL